MTNPLKKTDGDEIPIIVVTTRCESKSKAGEEWFADVPGHDAIGPFKSEKRAQSAGLIFAATLLAHAVDGVINDAVAFRFITGANQAAAPRVG